MCLMNRLGLLLFLRVPQRIHRPQGPEGALLGAHRIQSRAQDQVNHSDQRRAVLVGGLLAASQLRGRVQHEIRFREARY